MKKWILSAALITFLLAPSLAQEGKWSLGLGFSAEKYEKYRYSGAIYINRNLGPRWQVGIMPTTSYYQTSGTGSTLTEFLLGVHVNTRFYFLTETKLKPYAFGYLGNTFVFQEQVGDTEYTKTNESVMSGGIGLGLQYDIGKKGWSLDLNGALRYFRKPSKVAQHNEYFLSIGVFKKF